MESHDEPSRKRKLLENSSLQEHHLTQDDEQLFKRSKPQNSSASLFDIKSKSHDEHSAYPRMSLDLELNLSPCESATKRGQTRKSSHILIDLNQNQTQTQNHHQNNDDSKKKNNKNNNVQEPGLIQRITPRLISGDQRWTVDEEGEMVATVCKKCHMLVMLCKSSPACPNCKFMHSYEQSYQRLFFVKPSSTSSSSTARFSLLC